MRWGWLRGFGSQARVVLGAAALAAVIGSGAARAEEPQDPKGGKLVYDDLCAVCHGPGAKGDGPMAEELRTPPTDLTGLGKKYGMPLPRPKLMEFIDGRNMVRAHGIAGMPVWGKQIIHELPPTPGTEVYRRGTITSVIDWLETIQTK